MLIGVLSANNMLSSSIRLRLISDVIAAKAWSLSQAGDIAGFREILIDSEHFLQGLFDRETGTLVDEMVGMVCASAISESFADAASKLGLQTEAAHWSKISDRLKERKNKRDSRKFIVDGKVVETRTVTGGLFAGGLEMEAKQAEHQPPLTDGDLKPGRLFDHEILSRLCCYVLFILIAVCLGLVAVYRFRVSTMARRLAGRIEELLEPADWGWVLGAGVLLPFAFVMVVNRLTPLGGRQFGMLGNGMMMPAAHFLGLLVLWLVVPAQVANWRLAKRAGVFGFPKTSQVGWFAVVCAAAFVPLIGWAVVSDSHNVFPGIAMTSMKLKDLFSSTPTLVFIIALGPLGISILWVLFRISVALFCRATHLIWAATSSMVLVQVYATAMVLITLASVGFKASEQYWFDQDKLEKANANEPGWSHFEYQIATQMRKELREILGYHQ